MQIMYIFAIVGSLQSSIKLDSPACSLGLPCPQLLSYLLVFISEVRLIMYPCVIGIGLVSLTIVWFGKFDFVFLGKYIFRILLSSQ